MAGFFGQLKDMIAHSALSVCLFVVDSNFVAVVVVVVVVVVDNSNWLLLLSLLFLLPSLTADVR